MIIKLQQFNALIWKWNIGFRHLQYLWRLCILILLLKLELYSSTFLVSPWQFDTDSNRFQMKASHSRNCYHLIDLWEFLLLLLLSIDLGDHNPLWAVATLDREGGIRNVGGQTCRHLSPRPLLLFLTSGSCPSSGPAIPQCWTVICNQTNAIFCQAAFDQCYITTAEKQITKKSVFIIFYLPLDK